MTLWFGDVLANGVLLNRAVWGSVEVCFVRCEVFGWVDASLESVMVRARSITSFDALEGSDSVTGSLRTGLCVSSIGTKERKEEQSEACHLRQLKKMEPQGRTYKFSNQPGAALER